MLHIGRISIDCRKTKKQSKRTANQSKEISQGANEDPKLNQANCLKRGKTRMTQS